MKRFEYFQETSESISDDNWLAILTKHGDQGWELCSVVLQNTYVKHAAKRNDAPAEKKQDENALEMQTIYQVIFKRSL